MNDSSNLRASYAISRRNCDRTLGSPPRTSLRSAALNVSWQMDFWRRGKYSESRTLFMDAMELLEGRRSDALDPEVEQAYARSLIDLGWAARDQQRYDEALVWLQRAEEVLEDLAHEPQNLQVILSIDEVRRTIAELFRRRGQDESRRRLLESHIGMLERLSERAGADPAIGLLAALARVIVVPDESASATIRAAMERFPADRRLPQRLAERLAVWIARDIQPYPSDPKSTGKPQGRLGPGRPRPCGHPGARIKM